MNKSLKGLLVALLAVSAASANNSTNKTFLMPRSHGVNLPMEATTFGELTHRRAKDAFGGNLQVSGFYSASTNGEEQAKYFLFANKSKVEFVGRTAAAKDGILEYALHDTPGVAAANRDTRVPVDALAGLSLDPEQTAYGVRFDYHQDLSKILRGLYLRASLPVAHVENDVQVKTTSAGAGLPVAMTGLAVVTPAGDVLKSYLAGTYSNATAANAQEKLTHALVAGAQSETGVADIDVQLGYKVLDKANYHMALALGLTIPTGNEADGKYLFQPIVGNGKHFGLGGDVCAGARVWGDMDHNLRLSMHLRYRYLFESSQKRTLGLKNQDGSAIAFAQYALVQVEAAGANAALRPFANVFTVNTDVTPGSQLDGSLALAYNNGGWSVDLGYNMFYREAESVKIKGTAPEKYAVVNQVWDTTQVFPAATGANFAVTANGNANALNAGSHYLITKDNLDPRAAATDSAFTNAIYAGAGYTFKEWDTPLMLGVGGKYEFANDNNALEQWGVWGKVGVGF